jgi:hypothetical protein
MGESVWFIGENGALQCMDSDCKLFWVIKQKILRGECRRVHPGGATWDGDPFPVPPPPPPPEETLVIGTARGYRFFWGPLDHRKDFYLESPLGSRLRWLDSGRWTAARCKVCKVIPSFRACHGNWGYGCGFYALWEPHFPRANLIWGAVEGKGRIVDHPKGFRAQYARPVALALTTPHEINEWIRQVAGHYQIPALPVNAMLAEFPPQKLGE